MKSGVFWGIAVGGTVAAILGCVWNFGYSGYDDLLVLRDNWPGMSFWPIPGEQLYIPCSYVALSIERTVGEALGIGFPQIVHRVNLLLHVLNTLLVFRLLQRLTDRNEQKVWAAALGALLYGLHPLQVEAVGWTLGQRDLWSAFFAWSALLALPKSVIAAVLFFALSMISKPTSAFLPLAALLLGWKQDREQALKFLVAAPLVLLSVGWITFSLCGGEVVSQSLGDRFQIVGNAISFYTGKLVFPRVLVPHYADWSIENVLGSSFTGGAILGWGIFLAVSYLLRRQTTILVAWLLVWVLAIPSLGFLPFSFQAHSVVADRFFYLSLFGIGAVFTLGIGAVQKTWGALLGVLVVSSLAALSFQQVRLWKNPVTLWATNLVHYPMSRLGRANLSRYFSEQREFGLAQKVLEPYIEVFPEDEALSINLASSYGQDGKYLLARQHLQRVLEKNPNQLAARQNLENLSSLERSETPELQSQ